jgi:hypothetical protein
MDSSPDTDLQQRPAASSIAASRLRERLRRAGGDAVLRLHRQAERMDLVPPEFGQETEVDDTDAGSLAREWLRQARLWAGYNPEEMLALKAGAVALGIALLLLIVLVGAIR